MTTFEYICYLIGFWFVMCYAFCIVCVLLVLAFATLEHAYKLFKQRLEKESNDSFR